MNDTLQKSIDATEKFFNSEEGKKFVAEHKRKHRIQERIRGRWIKKLHTFMETASERKVNALIKKFLKWEEAYKEYRYTKHHEEAHSNIFGLVTDLFERKGVEVPITMVDKQFIRSIGSIDKLAFASDEEKIKLALDYVNKRAKKLEKESMFLKYVYSYGKYTLKIYSGQGCFYRIYKGKKQIW